LAIVAAAVFALPGVLSSGTREASAAPILSNGQGDVCFRAVNRGNQVGGGNPEIPVGVHFDAFARTQDSFHLPLLIFAVGFGSSGSVPGQFGHTFNPGMAGNYDVIPRLNPLDEPFVIPFHMAVSIDGQVGEAKIIDRVEDHSIASLSGRFPFVERNGVAWTWPSVLNVIDMFGVATENDISPVNTILGLDILTELAGGGGDMDSVNSDIQEFFVNPAAMFGTAEDERVARGALVNCGLPILSGTSRITAANMAQIWTDMIFCFTIGEVGACNDLAILLGINCSIGATAGCVSADLKVDINLDGWSQVSVMCTKPGEVKITWDPTNWYGSDSGSFSPTRNEGMSQDIECIGPAASATASATGSPATVEINPVGTSVSVSTIVVTVLDANGRRLDGAVVVFTTNNCRLGTASSGPFSGTSVTTASDTDSSSDLSFLAANSAPGNQLFAGTAEAYLSCASGATPGTATVTWVVNQMISGTGFVQTQLPLTGTVTVTVIGPPSGIVLAVTPASSTCGNPVTATATVTDSAGKPVSDGTQVYFTTVSATGAQGGVEGAQGMATTVNGVATIILSLDPTVAGTHTVSARTGGNDLTGAAVAVVNATPQTITCSAVAAAAPSVSPPRTGQGPSVTPPNTGDGGLADSSGTSYGLFALAGVAVMALVGVAKFGFARR
jgi:hypothetical protein